MASCRGNMKILWRDGVIARLIILHVLFSELLRSGTTRTEMWLSGAEKPVSFAKMSSDQEKCLIFGLSDDME